MDIFCDESCHLEKDHQPLMVLGALWLPHDAVRMSAEAIRALKADAGFATSFEMKWTKVSPGALSFYERVIDYFFDNSLISFRAVVARDKDKLDHAAFGQSHDDWYYKMYYTLLVELLARGATYHVYLDIKDGRGGPKTRKLHEILSHAIHDFDQQIIERVQIVRSEEIEVLQLADLLVGALSYANRGLHESPAKVALVDRIAARLGHSLDRTTARTEKKFNVLRWSPQQFL